MKTRSIITAVAIAISSLGFAATAQAETFAFSSSPLTNLDPAGATINGGFTKFPTKGGLYILECVAPVEGKRPVTCSDTLRQWVTATGETGSLIATGGIAIKVAGSITGSGVTVDCTKVQCGIFFQLAHPINSDTSEDKFMPISFKAGGAAPVLAADEITVTLNGTPLVPNKAINLAYRADAKIVATAKSGAAVTLESLNSECAYANGMFTALKGSGQCALQYTTAGNATTEAARNNFPFYLVPGTQRVTLKSLVIAKGKTKALPPTTNFGSEISYKSNSKNCRVELNIVEVKGACTLTATAAAKADMWLALKSTIKVTLK